MAAGIRAFAWPAVLTVLVVLGAILGPSALADPVTGDAASGVRLDVDAPYLIFAPLFNVWDTLSLLTSGQHIAVLATLILVFLSWRVFRRRGHRRSLGGRILVELGVAALALLGLLGFYAYGAMGPRPMAALVAADPDVVIVDVHSHTDHSHDGRDGFDAEDNREWHASAGFDAVYVSDHRTWGGYEEGVGGNPARAGAGTVLLSALEIKYANRYASALGQPWRYRAAMKGNHLIADTLYRALRAGGPKPTLVLTIPSPLDSIPRETADSIGFVAVEVSDASPRGLRQSRRDRAMILAMADSLDLATVAASNNHGWGRTAAAWTLMRVPDWRSMTPRRLADAIETKLHRERREAARVVERRVPYTADSNLAFAFTVPAIGWQMFGGLSTGERVSWLLWIWALGLLAWLYAGRRRGGTRDATA